MTVVPPVEAAHSAAKVLRHFAVWAEERSYSCPCSQIGNCARRVGSPTNGMVYVSKTSPHICDSRGLTTDIDIATAQKISLDAVASSTPDKRMPLVSE